MKKEILVLMIIVLISIILVKYQDIKQTSKVEKEDRNEGNFLDNFISTSYGTIIETLDWGASVTKLVIYFQEGVPKDVSKDEFEISVIRNYEGTNELTKEMSYTTFSYDISPYAEGKRVVEDVYISDELGNKVENKTKYITIELKSDPEEEYGNPLGTEINTGFNLSVVLDCNYTIKYKDEIICNTKNSEISQMILVDDFEHGLEYRTNTIEILKDQLENDVLYYASYKPKNQENNPLLIWLHGGGEGGTDTRIPLLGNKATVFAGDDFQNIMGGSYVLVPQCPTVWRNATGEGNDLTGENPTSIYTEILMELIENYVQENSTIDRKRIYIGGCSNGGYMTMNMLINYPEYFAAAFPICEAYLDEYISNEEIKKLAKIPIWFTHSVDDTVIDPEKNTISTYKRLLETGAKNTYLSLWKNVYDTSGKFKDNNGNPIEYFGHESWRYVFNNECTVDNDYQFNTSIEQVGNGKTIFEWLSEQQKN